MIQNLNCIMFLYVDEVDKASYIKITSMETQFGNPLLLYLDEVDTLDDVDTDDDVDTELEVDTLRGNIKE